jgi:predicted hydrocarbon binding protein
VAERSGLYYPNRFARYFFRALELSLGANAATMVTGQSKQAGDDMPPDSMERQFDFIHISRLNKSLELMYGERGGHGVALRVGRVWFNDGLRHFGVLAGLGHPSFQSRPLAERMRLGLEAFAYTFNQHSDQHCTLEEGRDAFYFIVENCPFAWGRRTEAPVCHALTGALQSCLNWATTNYEYHIYETACKAVTGEPCEFKIGKEPIGHL